MPIVSGSGETEEIAAEAIWLIDVKYEPLQEFLSKPRDSLKDVDPELQLHDKVDKAPGHEHPQGRRSGIRQR
ncbi:MAG: hypothetical protein R3E76_09605 [Planctomycetota bacterium]